VPRPGWRCPAADWLITYWWLLLVPAILTAAGCSTGRTADASRTG
jgi:hypothetical protein